MTTSGYVGDIIRFNVEASRDIPVNGAHDLTLKAISGITLLDSNNSILTGNVKAVQFSDANNGDPQEVRVRLNNAGSWPIKTEMSAAYYRNASALKVEKDTIIITASELVSGQIYGGIPSVFGNFGAGVEYVWNGDLRAYFNNTAAGRNIEILVFASSPGAGTGSGYSASILQVLVTKPDGSTEVIGSADYVIYTCTQVGAYTFLLALPYFMMSTFITSSIFTAYFEFKVGAIGSGPYVLAGSSPSVKFVGGLQKYQNPGAAAPATGVTTECIFTEVSNGNSQVSITALAITNAISATVLGSSFSGMSSYITYNCSAPNWHIEARPSVAWAGKSLTAHGGAWNYDLNG